MLGTEQFGVARYGAHLVVTINGEFDHLNSDDLSDGLAGALLPETSTLQIDASGVTFIDSSGLRSLLRFHRLAERSGVRVTIDPASNIVRRLLEVVHVKHRFDGSDGQIPDGLPATAAPCV